MFMQEHYQSVKQFRSRLGQTFCLCPDLGPNCLQRLSADEIFTRARKELRGGRQPSTFSSFINSIEMYMDERF